MVASAAVARGWRCGERDIPPVVEGLARSPWYSCLVVTRLLECDNRDSGIFCGLEDGYETSLGEYCDIQRRYVQIFTIASVVVVRLGTAR